MAVIIHNTIMVTNAELVKWGFPTDTISKFQKQRNPENAQEYLYYYDKIAERSEKAKAKLPEKELLIAEINALEALKEAEKCGVFTSFVYSKFCKYLKISDLYFFKQKKYSEAKSKALMNSMALLRFLADTKMPAALLKQVTGFETREKLFKSTIELFKNEEVEGVLIRKAIDFANLPASYDRLRKKVAAFEKYRLNKKVNECEFLCSYIDNCNSQVIGRPTGSIDDDFIEGTKINLNDFHAATLIKLAMNPGKANKFDLVEIYERYKKKCKDTNTDAVSLSAVKLFLAKPEVVQYYTWERNGFTSLENLLPHVHRKRPDFALRKGGMDGFQVDFYTTDKDKAIMLTCVAVFDYCSEAITGYEIGLVENGLLVRNAYRNHLRLNGGRTFAQLDMDASMANTSEKTKELFSRVVSQVSISMSDDPTGKHRSNSKSRFTERLIQEVNRLTQNLAEWKGTNVTSIDVNRKPNADYAKVYKQTIDEGIGQIVSLINVYNNKPLEKYAGKSRMQIFEQKIDPKADEIDFATMSQLFNWSTTVAVRGDVITVILNKTKHEYFVPDRTVWASKMDSGNRVKVYYDEADMSEVHVFGWELNNEGDPQECFLGSLKLGQRAFGDAASQTSEDMALIQEQTAKRKAQIAKIQRKQLEVEAYSYGINPAEYPALKDLEMVVKGARDRNPEETLEERYAEALATPQAMKMERFYIEHFENKGVRVNNTESTHQDKDLIKAKMKALGLE